MKVFRLRHGDFDIGPYNAWKELVTQRYRYCSECNDGFDEPCDSHENDAEVTALADVARELMNAHNRAESTHPVPEMARLRMRTRYGSKVHMICGMDSLESLDEWFRGFWNELIDIGFALATYDIPEQAVEQHHEQVLFRPQDARLISLDK